MSLKNYFYNLNLFEPPADSGKRDDEQRRRSNIIASRVYLAVLTLFLVIIVVTLWLYPQTTIITIQDPTKDQFESLPLDVRCPCSRTSVSYGDFTSLQVNFHQVCSSDFVSDRWIKAINSGSNSTYFLADDFRTSGSAQFQALAVFCRLSTSNVQQSITSFGMSTLFSLNVLTTTVLESYTNASIDQFKLTAQNASAAQLQLIREMTTANLLMSGLQTNAFLEYYKGADLSFYSNIDHVGNIQNDGSRCNCDTDIDCNSDSFIQDSFGAATQFANTNKTLMRIPGILTGCLPVNSILLSTLECFYNQTCLDKLISFISTTERFSAMIETNKSRFSSNSTVKSIVDLLMVENWISNISYDNYYGQCAPVSCTYAIVQRHHFIFVLTKVIGVLGGLSLVLGFLIPIVIRFIRRPRSVERTPRIPRK